MSRYRPVGRAAKTFAAAMRILHGIPRAILLAGLSIATLFLLSPIEPAFARHSACDNVVGRWTVTNLLHYRMVINRGGTGRYNTGITFKWSCHGHSFVYTDSWGITVHMAISSDGTHMTGHDIMGGTFTAARNSPAVVARKQRPANKHNRRAALHRMARSIHYDAAEFASDRAASTGRDASIGPSTYAVAAPASGLYRFDKDVVFNVLDQVEFDPGSGRLTLVGHIDTRYATAPIPYFQYLATLLDDPSPRFSLEWTRGSDRRVEELHRKLRSNAEWRRLVHEWGTWLDRSGHVTAAGRYFMPLFGITPPTSNIRDVAWMQYISGALAAVGERQQADIVAALKNSMIVSKENSTTRQKQNAIRGLFQAAGLNEDLNNLFREKYNGTISPRRFQFQAFDIFFQKVDQLFALDGNPTTRAYERAYQRKPYDDAITAGLHEFDAQLRNVMGRVAKQLWQSKPEFDVPVSLVNRSLRSTLRVTPRFYGVDRHSLLARLMFKGDYLAKKLINSPGLTSKIEGYQTEYAFKRSNPGQFRRNESSARLWISVAKVEASRSPDGNILAFGKVHMRINMRRLGANDRDVRDRRMNAYERLLTGLYDQFAQHYSPVFHELREAAKLAYAAQWLKARDARFRLPEAGRARWDAPSSVPGIIYITWAPYGSGPDVQTISAIGGISLHVPSPGAGHCVKFCADQIPRDPAVKPVDKRASFGEAFVKTCSTSLHLVPSRYLGLLCLGLGVGGKIARALGVEARPASAAEVSHPVRQQAAEYDCVLAQAAQVAGLIGEPNVTSPSMNTPLEQAPALGQIWDGKKPFSLPDDCLHKLTAAEKSDPTFGKKFAAIAAGVRKTADQELQKRTDASREAEKQFEEEGPGSYRQASQCLGKAVQDHGDIGACDAMVKKYYDYQHKRDEARKRLMAAKKGKDAMSKEIIHLLPSNHGNADKLDNIPVPSPLK